MPDITLRSQKGRVSAASAPLRDPLSGTWIEGTCDGKPKHSIRISHKVLPILRFTPVSALSGALKPHGTYVHAASYPVSTRGNPCISGELHFFCNKIANGC